MSIELPPIPAIPSADAPADEWARYLDILQLHAMEASTAATLRSGDLMQQMLNMPPASVEGFSEAGVLSLVSLLMRLPQEAP